MTDQHHNRPEPPRHRRWWHWVKQFLTEVFGKVAVRVSTLIITGVIVGMGWISAVVGHIVEFLTRLIFSVPAAPLPF